MCTVTWRRDEGGYELFFNRDELRTRKPAAPPSLRRSARGTFIAPTDGDFGGSWISVNASGVTLALLNGYVTADQRVDPSFVSRGSLVTSLADGATPVEVQRRLEATDLGRYRSFLLLVLAPAGGLLATWADDRLDTRPLDDVTMPIVSSSFENEAVRSSRVEQFRSIEAGRDALGTDDHLEFHAGHRPREGAFSVCMHRPDAQTVSFSWIEVTREAVRYRYTPHAPHAGIEGDRPVELPRLPLAE